MSCPYKESGWDLWDTCALDSDECDGFSCGIADDFEDEDETDDYPF